MFVVFIILQNTPETVYHEIFLIKLDLYRIRELPDSWLKSFLRNGKQHVIFPGYSSSVKTVTCGASQGSTLAFFLFVLYINDLFKKRLQHSYFPVKFETFLEHIFLQFTSSGCFCLLNLSGLLYEKDLIYIISLRIP